MNNESKIRTFTDLNTWKEAHKLVLEVYKLTKGFLQEEKYSLVDQMRRAAISITSNIAEGFSRTSYLEKTKFYAISQGSNTELQSQLLIAKDSNYVNQEIFDRAMNQSTTVHKLLNSLIKKSKKIHDAHS